ncbi:hypothetical protein DPEC_G00076080 [Dallia pectoralis]|uniref:Uncharacterized protein n=1 Tax=Dallia pectoralis TaxID=75939 RepID=A0ACC2H3N8_DALPE|nr:hypothetical protein DPEC_G00076080 [Dallia pectoralis]
MAEEPRRTAAQLDQPVSERDRELTSYIKFKFATNFKKEQSYLPEQVVTRSETRYVVIQNDQARKKFERRQELLSSGFFSPINKPYKTLGIIYSDNVDLYSKWLTSDEQESLKTNWEIKDGKMLGSGAISIKFTKEKGKREENITVGPEESQSVDGFLHLKQYLRELTAIKHALQTGRPLIFCLRKQSLQMTKPLHARTSCDRAMSAGTVPPELMSMNQQAVDSEEDKNRQILSREQELFSEKLQWIHLMLCGISHMRNRDLRNLVPLHSTYLKIIMKDTEISNVLLKQSPGYYNPCVNAARRLVSLAPEDSHNIPADIWETFNRQQDATEPSRLTPVRTLCCKSLQSGPHRRVGLRETEGEGEEDMPPWLLMLLDEKTSLEEKTFNWDIKMKQMFCGTTRPRADQTGMLERTRAQDLDVKRVLNLQIESRVFEKKRNREERMRTQLNAVMASKSNAGVSSLLTTLKSELKEPKSTTGPWIATLQKEATELVGDKDQKYNSMLQKISGFQSFSNNMVPFSKEKFCLLVHSMSANQLLRPAVQEALLFLCKNVLFLLPRQLKQWYQNLRLPFTTPGTS